jgi:hypothetical protein
MFSFRLQECVVNIVVCRRKWTLRSCGVLEVEQRDQRYGGGAESSTTGVLEILAEVEGPRVWGRKLLEAPKFGLGESSLLLTFVTSDHRTRLPIHCESHGTSIPTYPAVS